MRTIAIMNNKGGVGKTITAINLADILAADRGQRVVLVDCDGQANLTHFFLPTLGVEDAVTTGDILMGEGEPLWSENVIQLREGLSILPSSSGLYDLDLRAIHDGTSAPERLRQFAEAAADDGDVDWMIFDCPPGYTVSSVAALLAAHEVMIPVVADKFSIDGAFAVSDQVRRLAVLRPSLWVRALLTQTRSADVVTAARTVLARRGVPLYRTSIRRTDKVPESTVSLIPLREYSVHSSATRDYRCLARELMEV